VMARGINRQRIFQDDSDRHHWVELLAEMSNQFRLRVHAYALLDNHYHLILETTETNLSRAMQWLQVSYSMWHKPFVEAANFAVRYSPELRAWYQRKAARTKRVVALKALANKLAKACYFILRDGVEFDVKKLVG